MSDYKLVYLIIQHGTEASRQTFWRPAGVAYVCRDGSLNVKLDIHPGLTFNIRDPKSNGEREEANTAAPVAVAPSVSRSKDGKSKTDKKKEVSDDDIPF